MEGEANNDKKLATMAIKLNLVLTITGFSEDAGEGRHHFPMLMHNPLHMWIMGITFHSETAYISLSIIWIAYDIG
jgi:hypothetical protein